MDGNVDVRPVEEVAHHPRADKTEASWTIAAALPLEAWVNSLVPA